MDYGVKA